MVVKTRSKDGRLIGLHVGSANVCRYFPANISNIDLQLGHVHIQCTLKPEFWGERPEIDDARLADWLESMHLRPRSNGTSIELEMTCEGQGAFRLRPAVAKPCPATRMPCPVNDCSTCSIDRLRME